MSLASLAVVAARAGGFVGGASAGLDDLVPMPARLGAGVLLTLAAWPGAAPTPAPASVEAAAAAALVGACAGFAFSLPLRGLLAGAGVAAERLVRGGRESGRAAVLLGASAWVAGGGAASLLGAFLALEALPAGAAPWLVPEFPAQLGALLFTAAVSALLPALAFTAALGLLVALTTRPAGRPPWVPTLLTAAGVLFLVVHVRALALGADAALGAGARLVAGGG